MPYANVTVAHPGATTMPPANGNAAQFHVMGGVLPHYAAAVAPGPVGASSAPPGAYGFVTSAPLPMQPPVHLSLSPGGTLHTNVFHPPPLSNAHAAANAVAAASASFTTPPHPQQQQQSFRNLKVGGLPSDATDADLLGLFERFGKIVSAKVMINVQTCESRGYGFVLFDTQEAGCRAFGEMNGKKVTLRSGQPPITLDLKNSDWDGRQAAAETTCIYVRNLPNTVGDDELRALFSKFGVIVQFQTRLQPGSTAFATSSGATSLATSNCSTLVSNLTTGRNSPPTGGVSVCSSLGAFSFPGSAPPATLGDTPPHNNLSWSSAGVTLTSSFPNGSASTNPSVSSEGNCSGFGKMAMIEYATVEQARAAIAGSHRVVMFPNAANITVLSKFADSPSLRESKRQQKRPTTTFGGPCGVPKVVAPPPQVTVGSRVVSRGATHVGNGGTTSIGFLVSAGVPAAAPPPPSTATLRHSFSSPPQVGGFPTAATIADAVPLPITRIPGTWQRVCFRGMLGITPDGLLYPLRVDDCKEVDSSSSLNVEGHAELHGFPPAAQPASAMSQPQQELHGFPSIDGLMDLVNASRGASASTRGTANGTVPTFYVLPSSAPTPPEQQQAHGAQQHMEFSFELPGSVVLET